ncbi:NAD-P-binding protein [Lentinula guzmanii]|uniref:NAD-P-binding protein n=1 Tax=Lentinula guzmanii TaxID=2804957 RepID=A0AA38MXZ6_9AGAR|nr:NAD-P-binding protein [Lentinula guzmanii]
MPFSTWTLLLVLSAVFALRKLARTQFRASIIRHAEEKVLILGASSGIGREIAHQYAARGAKVCVVGRRIDKVTAVVDECKARSLTADGSLGIPADITIVEDMVRVRTVLEKKWAGIDTVIVAAGVSATGPLLEVAGVSTQQNANASEEGIQFAVNAAKVAMRNNYLGPMIAAISFIPVLKRTSKLPSILLISSLGAVIPAPTRSIYGSTKSASLLLYQALAIEHPSVRFSFVLPSSVEGDFRASAVDQSPLDNQTTQTIPKPNSTPGLRVTDVGKRCIDAVDHSEKVVFMPSTMKLGHILYLIWPSFIEKKAMLKYGFTPE